MSTSSAANPGDTRKLSCPSAQPEWPGAFIFGIVGGSAHEPRVKYLSEPLPLTEDLLTLTAPVQPTEVLRIAAPCVNAACQHFRSGTCRLGQKVAADLPVAAVELPACLVRDSCRWFNQEGASACFRCPQIVTDQVSLDPVMHYVTDPGA